MPIRAALSAVDTIEPARVRRRFAGGSSTWTMMNKLQVNSMKEREVSRMEMRWFDFQKMVAPGWCPRAMWSGITYMLGGGSLPRLPTHDRPLPNST